LLPWSVVGLVVGCVVGAGVVGAVVGPVPQWVCSQARRAAGSFVVISSTPAAMSSCQCAASS
jgi:hypothetical protein